VVRRTQYGDHGGREDASRVDGGREEVQLDLRPPVPLGRFSQRQKRDLSGTKSGNPAATTHQHKVRAKPK